VRTEISGAMMSEGQVVSPFGADSLPRAGDFASFIAAAHARSGIDLCFSHAEAGLLQADEAKLEWGINWFGVEVSRAVELFRSGICSTRLRDCSAA